MCAVMRLPLSDVEINIHTRTTITHRHTHTHKHTLIHTDRCVKSDFAWLEKAGKNRLSSFFGSFWSCDFISSGYLRPWRSVCACVCVSVPVCVYVCLLLLFV